MTGLSPFAADRDERGRTTRSAHAIPPARALYPRTAILPAAVITVVCVVASGTVLLGHASPQAVQVVLAVVNCGAVMMLVTAIAAARSAARRMEEQLRGARLVAQRGQAELQQMMDRLLRGEPLAPLIPPPARAANGSPCGQLTCELERSQYHAKQALVRVADKVVGSRSDQRVEIFVNLARRMQSLVHREIELLDDLEAKVEDPDLLKGLFTVDHLATRMRRQSESLAVLGGSTSRRQWNRQVTMHEVLRAAVAEVEQYSRVKVVPPVEGVLRGSAVTDVIHLVAELVENATKFSAPRTTALVRAQQVTAGIAVEVEDRGLGILPADQEQMNDLLADPGRMDVDELLRDGRIGLYVVAMLARRHGIRVRLQNNIYGGTQAIVVLPAQLLDEPDQGQELSRPDHEEEGGPRLALVPTGGATVGGATAGGHGDEAARSPLPSRPVSDAIAGGHGDEAVHSPLPSRSVRQPEPGPSGAPAPVYGSDFARPLPDAPGARPPLPRRQASYDTQQFDIHRDELSDATAARSTEPPADQMTGLMADFLRGAKRSAEEDSSARD